MNNIHVSKKPYNKAVLGYSLTANIYTIYMHATNICRNSSPTCKNYTCILIPIILAFM